MLHGRMVRPPAPDFVIDKVDERAAKKLPGNVRVVANRNFVGVVADREEQAIKAARALKVQWKQAIGLPAMKDMPAFTRATRSDEKVLTSSGDVDAALKQGKTHRAQYYVPHQMHASIGASCAVASVTPEGVTLWSPTQSSFNLRDAVAKTLGVPADKVHLVWVEGSGCYGHNGADDVTADAAVLSQAVGKPVRVSWMRPDQPRPQPKGPAKGVGGTGALRPRGEGPAS